MELIELPVEQAAQPSPPAVRGQPTKYRPEYCEAVVEHMRGGGSLTSFAASIDVARKTITLWAGEHEAFADAVGRGKAHAAAWWEERARKVAEGEGGPGAATMCIFGVKNMAGDDWQERQQMEHTGRVLHQALTHQEALEEAARRGLPSRVLEE